MSAFVADVCRSAAACVSRASDASKLLSVADGDVVRVLPVMLVLALQQQLMLRVVLVLVLVLVVAPGV